MEPKFSNILCVEPRNHVVPTAHTLLPRVQPHNTKKASHLPRSNFHHHIYQTPPTSTREANVANKAIEMLSLILSAELTG